MLLDLILPDIFVNLEEDDLEGWLVLDQVQDLEVLFVELGLGLGDQQVEIHGDFFDSLDGFGNGVEAKYHAEYLLKCPHSNEEEFENVFLCRSLNSLNHVGIKSWWSLVAT